MIKNGSGKKIIRNIYAGGVPFDSYEQSKIEELNIYITRNGYDEIPRDYPDSEKLKFLHANEFKIKETVISIIDHLRWRIETLPCKIT
jgi:hypothetical protein